MSRTPLVERDVVQRLRQHPSNPNLAKAVFAMAGAIDELQASVNAILDHFDIPRPTSCNPQITEK